MIRCTMFGDEQLCRMYHKEILHGTPNAQQKSPPKEIALWYSTNGAIVLFLVLPVVLN